MAANRERSAIPEALQGANIPVILIVAAFAVGVSALLTVALGIFPGMTSLLDLLVEGARALQ